MKLMVLVFICLADWLALCTHYEVVLLYALMSVLLAVFVWTMVLRCY